MLRYALGLTPASTLNVDKCDMDGNGVVDISDALAVLRMALGLI